MWQPDPTRRPAIRDVLEVLEKAYFDSCLDIITVAQDSAAASALHRPTSVGKDDKNRSPLLKQKFVSTPQIPVLRDVQCADFWSRLATYKCPQFANSTGLPLWAVFSTSAPYYCITATDAWVHEFGLLPLVAGGAGGSHLFSLLLDDATADEAYGDTVSRLGTAIFADVSHHELLRLRPRGADISSVAASAGKLYSLNSFPLQSIAAPELPSKPVAGTGSGGSMGFGSVMSPMFIAPFSHSLSSDRGQSIAGTGGVTASLMASLAECPPSAACVHSAVVMISFAELVRTELPKEDEWFRDSGDDSEVTGGGGDQIIQRDSAVPADATHNV